MREPNGAGVARPSIASLPAVQRLVELALDEDAGRGDVTTAAVVGNDGAQLEAAIVAREPLVVYGIEVARLVFSRVDAEVVFETVVADGASVAAGDEVAIVRGAAGSILVAERTALNFMQRLSGVATLSRRFADAVAGTTARVVDTRKTTPGFRALEKAAVLAGGCGNHRFDLGSGVLIKDNHIAAVGSVRAAVERARANAPHALRVEVEVEDRDGLEQALAAGADVVLLDNMTVEQVKQAAALAHAAGVLVEVSGGISLATAPAYAACGVDVISAGALTHSAPAVDLALDVRPRARAAP